MAKRKGSGEPEVVQRDGMLCATFVNSGFARRKGFSTYGELLAWGVRCGAATAGDAERLSRAAAERPDDAKAVVRRALEVRGLLGRILSARVDGQTPAAADVEQLNAEIAAAAPARRLVPAARGFCWDWGDRGGDDLDRMLWPVLESASEVLSSRYYFKVRRCAGEGCDLLFVDRTPGSPRKWCSMRACGARVKASRHYHTKVKPERRETQRQVEKARREEWESELATRKAQADERST